MHKRQRVVQGLVVGAAIVAATAAPALGAATEVDLSSLDVTDAGGNIWEITHEGGTDTGEPGPDAECDETPGVALDDAETGNDGFDDAYDYGAMVWINDEVIDNPDETGLLTTDGGASTVTFDTAQRSGLDVTMSYTFLAGNTGLNGVARTLVTLSNPSAAAIDAQVDFVTNFGSDEDTFLFKDQTGDGNYTTADRWIVTTDDPDDSSDPINTTVFFGPGEVASKPVVATGEVFVCSGSEGAWDRFETSVPAGGVQHYVFFNMITEPVDDEVIPTGGADDVATPQATPPNAAVEPFLAQFDSAASASNPLFAGIPAEQLPNIVNWAPAQVQPTTTTTAAPTTTTTAPPQAVTVTPRFTG